MLDRILDNLSWITGALITITVIILFVMGISGIISNNGNKIDSGIIVDKYMDSGGTYYHSGEKGGSLRSMPPSYSFTIRGSKDGEIVDYTFEVSADEYAAYKIGDEYHR